MPLLIKVWLEIIIVGIWFKVFNDKKGGMGSLDIIVREYRIGALKAH